MESVPKHYLVCLTTDKRLVVQISTWKSLQEGNFREHLQAALAQTWSEVRGPAILDLRRNGGGDTGVMVETLCLLGNDGVIDALNAREFVISVWPREFLLPHGKSVSTASLKRSGNTDLFREDATVHVLRETNEAKNSYSTSFFARFGMTSESCAALRDTHAARTQWIVLTDGGEFSSTENFLSVIRDAPEQFRIVGRNSMGGSGFPTQVTLPNTKLKLMLSQGRQRNSNTASFEIEGVGIGPDIPFYPDNAEKPPAPATTSTASPTLNTSCSGPSDPPTRPATLHRSAKRHKKHEHSIANFSNQTR